MLELGLDSPLRWALWGSVRFLFPHLPFFSSFYLVCPFRGLSLFCPFGLPGRRSRRHSGEGGSGETRARLREEVLPTGLGLDHFVPCDICGLDSFLGACVLPWGWGCSVLHLSYASPF